MHDGHPRRYAGSQNRRRRPTGLSSRPDRVALWAVFMAVIAMLAAAASSADAAAGGVDAGRAAGDGCHRARAGGGALSHDGCGRGLEPLNWRRATATWYGPGLFGNRTACGGRLTRRTVGVAHRSLPCGTRVAIRYRGRMLRTRVIDRGPYGHAATWDLTRAAARRLQLLETDRIRSAVVR